MNTKKTILYSILGLVIGAFLFFISMMSTGGGHGSYLLPKVLFPYSMLLGDSSSLTSSGLLVLMFIQYIVYTLIIGFAAKKERTAIILVTIHTFIAILALLMVEDF